MIQVICYKKQVVACSVAGFFGRYLKYKSWTILCSINSLINSQFPFSIITFLAK